MSKITVNLVSKSFGSESVLDNINLNIDSGSVVALLGSSGSGKTTLLRALAGFEQIDHGTISIDQKVVSCNSASIAVEDRQIGFIFQDHALFPHLNVRDNILFGTDKSVNKRFEELIIALELWGILDKYPDEISGGQAQRCAVARTLVRDPEIVLLDEPFASFDASMRTSFAIKLKHLFTQLGTTAIFVTHDQQEAFLIADYVAVINNGKVEQFSKPEELYYQPRTEFCATFIGNSNLIKASVRNNLMTSSLGSWSVDLDDGDYKVHLTERNMSVESNHSTTNATVISSNFIGPDFSTRCRINNSEEVISLSLPKKMTAGEKLRISVSTESLVTFPC